VSTSEQIRVLAAKMNISISEIARKCGKSPQSFNQKVKREGFTPEELKEIAKRLDIDYESKFILKGGEKV
jgi:transcriptional regulator with XRE-family HTH domain